MGGQSAVLQKIGGYLELEIWMNTLVELESIRRKAWQHGALTLQLTSAASTTSSFIQMCSMSIELQIPKALRIFPFEGEEYFGNLY